MPPGGASPAAASTVGATSWVEAKKPLVVPAPLRSGWRSIHGTSITSR